MKFLRALSRFLYFALYSVFTIVQILSLNLFRGENITRSLLLRRSWARHLLPRIGIKLEVSGHPPDFACIIMGNHRSYIDPLVLIHDVLGFPVSKAEVSSWPIIGYGARVSGVLFLERESSTSRKYTLKRIAQKAADGYPVFLYPEGTTGAKDHTLDFRPGGFKLAVSNNIPVVPVAIEFGSKDDYWVGNDTFVSHFFRRFSQKTIHVAICYGNVIQSTDPVFIQKQCKDWIDGQLLRMQESLRRRVEN